MSFPPVFALTFSPVTNKKFVLTQYIGGIERNATNHIVKAEAMSILYGIKYNPILSKTEGRSVGLTFTNISI